jgi:hypothetical protein
LGKGATESRGKRLGPCGQQSGTVHLRWAFAEAAGWFWRHHQPGKAYFAKLEPKHGKAKALTGLAHKVGRAGSYLLTRAHAFALHRFVSASPRRGEPEPTVSLADNGESPFEVPS